jgi:hypothetical protein
LFLGSISIELNHFNPGPSHVSNKKAHGKRPFTSPSNIFLFPTILTNSSNPTLSPTKKSLPKQTCLSKPSLEIYNLPKPASPFPHDHESSIYHSPNPKTHLKKKRHCLTGTSTPHKKGPGALSLDLQDSDDMDTSSQFDTNSTLPSSVSTHSPHHFFKAARKGKKVAYHATPSHNSGDTSLSPKTS